MDNPSNINDIKIALELHKAAEEQLKVGRATINRRAFEASGLKRGDVVQYQSPYSKTTFGIEVTEVSVLLSTGRDGEGVARLRVHGHQLNKDGSRRRTWRSASEYLENCTLVRRASDNG